MLAKIDVRCVAQAGCLLGEGPVWDAVAGVLWWVDIKAPAIHRLDPRTGRHDSWAAPGPVGALALRKDGRLLLALKSGFAFHDVETGRTEAIGDPEPDLPGNRMNDGKCDAQGRFWAGTMDDAEDAPSGHLYRLDPDRAITRFDAGFVVTNGMGWSGDGRTFYFTDSVERTIWAYDFDMQAGQLGQRRVFTRLGEADGYPDGLCVDAEDHVWSCHWDGGRISRYAPDGSVVLVVPLPAPRPSSCCFGGDDLDVLYVTSASIGLDAAERAAAPLSGGVFAVESLGVRGRPMPRFGG